MRCGENATQHVASIGEAPKMYTATKVAVRARAWVPAGAATAQAQNNASINVTAAVQQPITVVAATNLDFGNVFPGVVKGITLASPAAGRFSVTGQASTPVSMTFVVPANLTSDRKSTRLNSSHSQISYAVFCLK